MVPVHFFDITCKASGPEKCWSPNTVKIRVSLNYKGIPYTQTYLSYPDIRPILEELGKHDESGKKGFGGFTCPAIYHPESLEGKVPGGQVLTEGLDIALHLDEIYPEHPLFPAVNGYTKADTVKLAQHVMKLCAEAGDMDIGRGRAIAIPPVAGILDDRGAEYFIRTRTEAHPQNLSPEKWGSEDPEVDWKAFTAATKPIADLLVKHNGPFLLGDTFSYGDAQIVGQIVWIRAGGEDSYKRVRELHGGIFGKLYDKIKEEGWIDGQGEEKEWPAPAK